MLNFYDTSTEPTPAMIEAMAHAELGDDVYHTDPTVNELERLGAAILGHEDAVFMPTGTMSNLSAVLAAAERGTEAIAEANSHIVYYEAGGMAAVAGVMPRTIPTDDGVLTAERVSAVPAQARSALPADLHAVRGEHAQPGRRHGDRRGHDGRAAGTVRRAPPAPARGRGTDLQRGGGAGRRRRRAVRARPTRSPSA